jgi:hypothetical protein
MVEVVERRLIGRIAGPGDARAEHDALHRHAARRDPLHRADRDVLVGFDEEVGAAGEIEEEQHVAARQRRDERLLRVDCVLARPGRRHDGGRGGSGHLDSAVEAPGVEAAVAALGEILVALAPPEDGGGIFVAGHQRVAR